MSTQKDPHEAEDKYDLEVRRIAEIIARTPYNPEKWNDIEAFGSEVKERLIDAKMSEARAMVAEMKKVHYKGYVKGLAAMEQFPEDTETNIDRRTAYYGEAAKKTRPHSITQTNRRIMKTGIELIAAERQRQIEKEGYTAKHDTEHSGGELAMAAMCYTMDPIWRPANNFAPLGWPWIGGENDMFKPCPDNRIKELTKAGALIAAEIDRLQAEHGYIPEKEEE